MYRFGRTFLPELISKVGYEIFSILLSGLSKDQALLDGHTSGRLARESDYADSYRQKKTGAGNKPRAIFEMAPINYFTGESAWQKNRAEARLLLLMT